MIVDRMSRLHRRVIQCIVVLGAVCAASSSGGSLISPVQAQGFMHMAGPRFQSRAPGVMPRYAPRYAPGYGPRYEPRFGSTFRPGYARRYGPRFAPDAMRSAGRNGRTDTYSRSATRAGKMTRRDAGLSNARRRGQHPQSDDQDGEAAAESGDDVPHESEITSDRGPEASCCGRDRASYRGRRPEPSRE